MSSRMNIFLNRVNPSNIDIDEEVTHSKTRFDEGVIEPTQRIPFLVMIIGLWGNHKGDARGNEC